MGPPWRQGMNSLSNSESPLKRTNEFFSPLKRTFALRQGFQPLSDYRFISKFSNSQNGHTDKQ
ncbi:hypothetical protein CP500_002235 [Tychonema bourrellyi FEM_GT703]|uniref:Uncharacterized protein n=1 Tax=Tychonema bourrellyi FEM_GT703 TaxID=2040638 RepID=A0A2G4F6B2_9CYAN|nr:hypothetical protein CP500_002235 [Tychonema bourrellyi FEM_GT703]